jgi:hypothetical protein
MKALARLHLSALGLALTLAATLPMRNRKVCSIMF